MTCKQDPIRRLMRGISAGLRAFIAPILAIALAACGQEESASNAGFAGLGQEAGEFLPVERGRQLQFPADHGAHDGYRIEWWYITGNLTDDQGRAWGVQWTLFRSALRPGQHQTAPQAPSDVHSQGAGQGQTQDLNWSSPNVWMAHAAVTGPLGHRYAETFARGGIGQAGVQAKPFKAWIDHWMLRATSDDGIQHLVMQAHGDGFSYDLQLNSNGPLVLHGDQGYSQKSGQGQASYYYSQPFYQASGTIELDGKRYPVAGSAWMDREWSSQPLTAEQHGWDWFSLHLNSAQGVEPAAGSKLMLFQVRQANGQHYRAGTLIAPDGQTQTLRPEQIQLQEQHHTRQRNGKMVPTQWRVQLPDFGVNVSVAATEPHAWMGTTFPYWEGPVTIEGSAIGLGYLEMTGY